MLYKAVAYPTKILFWKRITAESHNKKKIYRLLLILQRYYFESESQLIPSIWICATSCCLSYKDTILKANHSDSRYHFFFFMLLLILQRYYFESESQLSCSNCSLVQAVAYPTKILFWKRITALRLIQNFISCCCLSYKDTILKANHSRCCGS